MITYVSELCLMDLAPQPIILYMQATATVDLRSTDFSVKDLCSAGGFQPFRPREAFYTGECCTETNEMAEPLAGSP